VEDPYGPRLITLDPSYTSNPYVNATSLGDPDRWPELAITSSPQISEDEAERPLGYPGARLKYTQTITGNKAGGFGIRVNGKRVSTSKRMSSFVNRADPRREEPSALSTTAPVGNGLSSTNVDEMQEESNKDGGEDVASTSISQPNLQVQPPTAVEDTPVVKAVQFVPKFAGAAEMEARRRARMAARRMPGPGAQPPPTKAVVDFSSSEEDGDTLDDDSDDFGVSDQVSSIDETDEFDP
jgi:hypothetical protein